MASIMITAKKAENVRTNARGGAPDPLLKLRILQTGLSCQFVLCNGESELSLNVRAGGKSSGPYSSSAARRNTTEPNWNEDFTLGVKDPTSSQLEVTMWDDGSNDDTTAQKFLGEVILNLAKLVPYNNTFIEQVFEIKQGKTHKISAEDKKATGKLKLGLKMMIPDESSKTPSQPSSKSTPLPSPAPAHAPPPKPAVSPAQGQAPDSVRSPEEGNVKPSQLRKTRDPDLPKGMVPPVALPGQGKLFVTVHSVQNVPKSDAASGAPPYPYVIIALEGALRGGRKAQARTVTRDKEENPSYGEKEFVFGVDNQGVEAAKLHFKLFDWNRGKDENLGSFVVNLADVELQPMQRQMFVFDGAMRGVTSSTRSVVSVRWAPASGEAPDFQRPPASSALETPKRDPPTTDTSEEFKAPQSGKAGRPSSGGPADVGIVFGSDGAKIIVERVLTGGPAEKSNQVRVRDVLIDVDGHDVVGLTSQDAQAMLSGDKNSPITMIFRRGEGHSNEQVVVTLLRAMAGGRQGLHAIAPAGLPAKPVNAALNSDILECMKGLRSEFKSISFLWGDTVTDAVQENMTEWKFNMLYGPKRDVPTEPIPIPPGLKDIFSEEHSMAMIASQSGLRKSFTGPAPNISVPIYRSFDQGSALRY